MDKLLWHASPYIEGGGPGTKCFDDPKDAVKYLEEKCEQDSTSYKLKEKIQEWYWIEKIWVSSDGNACVFSKRNMEAFNEYLIELGGANWFARTEASL